MHIIGNFYCKQAVGESRMLNLVQIIFADIAGELHVEEFSQCQGAELCHARLGTGRLACDQVWNSTGPGQKAQGGPYLHQE